MIQLDEKQLHQLQRVELELLLEADRICRKCGIHYNIIAGTLLGAVRHGGFIPWDDDADIALLRGEYEKFRRACETELDTSRFYFQDHENTPGYRWGYGKLRRKGTTFLREHQEHMPYEQGVFIDVFPLDSVPAAPIARQVHSARCYLIRKFLWSEVGKTAAKNPWKRLLFRVMSCVPRETIFRRYAKLVEAGCHHSSRWVRILTFPTPTKDEGYLRAWYEHSAPTVFEGQTFSGIADVDSYLSFKFGNYHELPPESQRKVHPVTKLQLVEPQMTKTNVLRGGQTLYNRIQISTANIIVQTDVRCFFVRFRSSRSFGMEQMFAFNVWDVGSGKAIIEAAAHQHCAVILQTSSRVFAVMDRAEFAAHVRSLAEKQGVPLYLHLDHCKDMALLRAAVDAGWDSVMVDASALPLAENIAMTNKIAAYAHAHGVHVEAEVGQIGKTGRAEEDAGIPVASMEDIRAFLRATDIDLFAAAIGTAHGLYHGTPVLHHDMIEEIGYLTDLPFVIHGGTGLSDDMFRALLAHPNVKKINISTEVKQAYRRGILASIDEGLLQVMTGQGFEATAVAARIAESIRTMAEEKLALLRPADGIKAEGRRGQQ